MSANLKVHSYKDVGWQWYFHNSKQGYRKSFSGKWVIHLPKDLLSVLATRVIRAGICNEVKVHLTDNVGCFYIDSDKDDKHNQFKHYMSKYTETMYYKLDSETRKERQKYTN